MIIVTTYTIYTNIKYLLPSYLTFYLAYIFGIFSGKAFWQGSGGEDNCDEM